MQEMQELQETGVHLDYLGSPINKLADDISRLFGGDAQTRQKGAAGDAGDRGALGLPGIAPINKLADDISRLFGG
jgi:hypothetical protein